MKKISLLVFAFFLIASAGDWGYEDVEGTSGTLFSFDTIEAFYSVSMDIANGKKIPNSLFISHWLTPNTVDSVRFIIALDYSNDKSKWVNFGNIDTVNLTTTQAAAGTEVNGTVEITPYDFRYIRLNLQSITEDTFGVYLQKSFETE